MNELYIRSLIIGIMTAVALQTMLPEMPLWRRVIGGSAIVVALIAIVHS